ncbi:DNA helicase MCM9-like [Anthonomus grandis grandis]|uniref:DNA helicase MCM9-like n=1 Tax=Anthonomus grandis grandis TaxID=2921223 RepID=UPI00216592EF|nr:DNA helicase MCM9-like [Anthonomus grandis grandis]XP_050310071.1 DNA helicase MCM9-like [Anthonomus grandis grandis]
MCDNYILQYHKQDILTILENPNKEGNFCLNINFQELFDREPTLGRSLLSDPETVLKKWNDAAFMAQGTFLKNNPNFVLKNNVNCRVYNLPPSSQTSLPGNEDVNRFLQVTGTVVRMSARKLLEFQRQYICVKCKYPVTVEAQYDKMNIIKQPKSCPNPEGCNSKTLLTFGELHNYNCKDYQEIKIQEDLSRLEGAVPNHMIVTLEDDLVNTCKPGENVTITVIVKRRWAEFDKGAKILVDVVIRANYLEVNNSACHSFAVSDEIKEFFEDFWERHAEEPLIGRSIILKSIVPEICGLHLMKLALAIVLAGGSPNKESEENTGVDRRSESHLLFVGDPGTGKSQMLRFASKIISGSVLTTGVGSTGAGLTVTAVMDNGEWQLEAGALVMADGSLCCIDEFNSMKEHDRRSIHEAMEQQTISVAKAGIVCKLKTRCTILAACNPKGNLDPDQPLCMNVAMSSPLLSRFDLILLMRDIVNEENDRNIAKYLLNVDGKVKDDSEVWTLKILQAYYSIIRKEAPKLTIEAETILSTYYRLQKQCVGQNKARTTVRLLESLIRLSQGHAKLMFHQQVEIQDTIFAIVLIDTAMDRETSLLNLKVDNDSFERPEEQYWEISQIILEKLNLDYIYEREVKKKKTAPFKKPPEVVPQKRDVKPALLFTQKRFDPEDILTQNGTSCLRAIQIRNNSFSMGQKGSNFSEDSGNFSKDYSSGDCQKPSLPKSNLNSFLERHTQTQKGTIHSQSITCRREHKVLNFTEKSVGTSDRDYSSGYAQKIILDQTEKQTSPYTTGVSSKTIKRQFPKSLLDDADLDFEMNFNKFPCTSQNLKNPAERVEGDTAKGGEREDEEMNSDKIVLGCTKQSMARKCKANISEDSGNFTIEYSPMINKKPRKFNFVKKNPKESPIVEKPDLKKSLERPQPIQTKQSKKSLSEVVKSYGEMDWDMDFDQYFDNIKSQQSQSEAQTNRPKFESHSVQSNINKLENSAVDRESIASDDLDIENCVDWNLGEDDDFPTSTQVEKNRKDFLIKNQANISVVEKNPQDVPEKRNSNKLPKAKSSIADLFAAFKYQPREDKEEITTEKALTCTTNTEKLSENAVKNIENEAPKVVVGKANIYNGSKGRKPTFPKSVLDDEDFDLTPFDFTSQISERPSQNSQKTFKKVNSETSLNENISSQKSGFSSISLSQTESEFSKSFLDDEDLDFDKNPFLPQRVETPGDSRDFCDMGQKTQMGFIRDKFTFKKGGKLLSRTDSSSSTN